MKKFTVLCLAGLLVLAFGMTAYAQEPKLEFRASGFIDAQTFLTENVPPLNANATPIYNSIPGPYSTFVPAGQPGAGSPNNALNKTVSYWDSRMHLAFDAVMGKELSARLQFEIDATRWGDGLGAERPGSEAHAVGSWSTDKVAIEVKYMYMDVGLPYFGIPVPMTVRVGAQPMAIRPWFFAATDGVGISGGIKIDPVNINPFYFKPTEGFDWTADDVDIYGMQVNAKVGTFTLGGYGAYYNMNQYPASKDATFDVPPPQFTDGTNTANLWWFGIYADGKAGPVDINFDMGYDFGKVKGKGNNTASYVKYSGWAGRLKVDYPWEKFNFGVIGMYASGSDAEKTSSTGLPGSIANNGLTGTNAQSTRVNGWMVPIGSEAGAANQESVVFYGWEPGASGGAGMAVNHNYNQASKGPFGGTWFAKLYGSYKLTPWWKITLQGLYIGDTTKNGNTFGNARRTITSATPGQPNALLRDDSFIGVEVDGINEFQIYRNLVFKVGAGYLFAGNALDLYNPVTNANWSMHSPWAVRTRLMYSF